MANLDSAWQESSQQENLRQDSSWQASVIKLAQTGNSRAIAFWLNRDLVPQGICAQIVTEPTGRLAIQIVSRQLPDCDQLVRYVCHRLCQLDSDVIQQVRITAQLIGSPEILWEKSARIILPSARLSAKPSAKLSVNQAQPSPQSAPVAVAAASAQSPVQVLAPASTAPANTTPVHTAPAAPKAANKLAQPLQPSKSGKVAQGQPDPKTDRLREQIQRQIQALKLNSIAVADRSIRWFMAQQPASRALVLGGSAVAAFLIGCGVELLGYYANPSAFQRSTATLGGLVRNAIPSGSVQTVSERIPIIRQPVLNPDDPAISLMFSNSDLLTRLPVSQRNPGQLSPSPLDPGALNPGALPVTALDPYRQADMLVTNLNHPITWAAAAKSTPAATPSPDATSGTSEETLRLSGLPAEPESDIEAAVSSDHEAEKMAFIADQTMGEAEAAAEPAGEAEPDKKQMPLTPQELVANRVSLVNLANSAVMPEGQTQLTQAVNLLRQGNIYAVGAGQTLPEARRPQIFEVKGKRIAYLGYSDSSPRAASGITAGVNVGVLRQMQEDIQAIRDQVDWVVVSFNWNRELRAYPEDWQINLAHAAVDNGADLVVGYHPTATQGGELYNGRAIVYSLGNAIDEYSDQPVGSYEAAALKVTLKDQIMQLEFLPIQVKKGQAQVAQGTVATQILQYLQQASSLFDQPLQSPTSLNSQVRLTLPSAPNSDMPTDPFISYPSPSASPSASPEPDKPQP